MHDVSTGAVCPPFHCFLDHLHQLFLLRFSFNYLVPAFEHHLCLGWGSGHARFLLIVVAEVVVSLLIYYVGVSELLMIFLSSGSNLSDQLGFPDVLSLSFFIFREV